MNNDECVFGIPSIQCPSCGHTLDVSGKKIEKLSKRQRRDIENLVYASSTNGSGDRFVREPDREDKPSEMAEHTYVIVTCDNMRCEQYNKFKSLEFPRIKTPSIRVEL